MSFFSVNFCLAVRLGPLLVTSSIAVVLKRPTALLYSSPNLCILTQISTPSQGPRCSVCKMLHSLIYHSYEMNAWCLLDDLFSLSSLVYATESFAPISLYPLFQTRSAPFCGASCIQSVCVTYILPPLLQNLMKWHECRWWLQKWRCVVTPGQGEWEREKEEKRNWER